MFISAFILSRFLIFLIEVFYTCKLLGSGVKLNGCFLSKVLHCSKNSHLSDDLELEPRTSALNQKRPSPITRTRIVKFCLVLIPIHQILVSGLHWA